MSTNVPTKAALKALQTYGRYTIKSMFVCRFPMSRAITDILNLVSLGKFNAVRHKIGLDTLFHLFVYLVLENDVVLILTKNEIVKIIDDPKKIQQMTFASRDHKQLQCISVDISVDIPVDTTLGSLFVNAMAQNDQFWSYDVRNNNCQDFVLNLLQGSQLLTRSTFEFVKQDALTLFHQLPQYVSKLSNNVLHELAKLDIQIL
jgi:hypothetical protein